MDRGDAGPAAGRQRQRYAIGGKYRTHDPGPVRPGGIGLNALPGNTRIDDR